jgi:hypothetical protein
MGEWGIAPSFLTWALDGSEWSTSRLCPLYHSTGGCVGPGASPEPVKKVKISRVRAPMRSSIFFPLYLILPAILISAVHSASNINEYQKQVNVSGE